MTLITMPSAGQRTVTWELDQPSELSRSEWTGRTSVLVQNGARWRAKVEVVPGSEAALLDWLAFMFALRGRVNTFELAATEQRQLLVPVATVTANTGSTGNLLYTLGWGGSTNRQVLAPGSMVSLGGRLYGVPGGATTGVDGFADRANFAVEPQLAAATSGETVKVRAPVGTMRLTGTKIGWTAAPGVFTPGGFDCEESF